MNLYRVMLVRKRDYGAKKHTVRRFIVRADTKDLAIAKAGAEDSMSHVEHIFVDLIEDDVVNDGYLFLSRDEVETFRRNYNNKEV